MLRTGGHLVPDEASLTSTAWMAGVFHSLVTQGHVSINRFLSTTRQLPRPAALRTASASSSSSTDGYHLLDVPSAFEMTPNGCRWIYTHAGGVIEVRSLGADRSPRARLSVAVAAGAPRAS